MVKTFTLCTLLLGAFLSTATAEPIKIGVLTDLSGKMAYWGAQTRVGALLAAKDLEAEGLAVKIILEDHGLDTRKAISGAQKLLFSDRVDAIYTEFSATSIAAEPVVRSARKLYVFDAGASSPVKAYEFAFKSFIDYQALCRETVRRWQALGLRRIATLKMVAEPGELCERGAKEILPDITSVDFSPNDPLDNQLLMLKRQQIEGVVFVAFEPDLINFLNAAARINYKPKGATNQNAFGEALKKQFSAAVEDIEFFGIPAVAPDYIARLSAVEPSAPTTNLDAAALAYLHVKQIGKALSACPLEDTACAAARIAASAADPVIGFLGFKERIAQFKPAFFKWSGDGWQALPGSN